MEQNLIFTQIPQVEIASNRFNCPIVIQYKDVPMMEFITELAMYTPSIPIFHQDGTKLAIAKGSQIYETEEGKKAGVTMRHFPECTVCEIAGKPAFEMRRNGAAALKTEAELFTHDGMFLKWSNMSFSGLLHADDRELRIGGLTMSGCTLQGNVGIQIGEASCHQGAAVSVPLPS